MQYEQSIGSLLNGLRRRVDAAAPSLGGYQRMKSRRGKPVSQEEIAEAVGVTRNWYQRVEGGGIRPSPSLLNRLADALNATTNERRRLFSLAMPAFATGLTANSAEAYESLGFVRAISSRLLAATSEFEALTTAGEHLATWFVDASLIVPVKRLDEGQWKWWSVNAWQETVWSRCIAEIGALTTRRQFDGFWSYPQLQWPGETVNNVEQEQLVPDVRSVTLQVHEKHGVDVPSFLRSRITTRRGLVAGIQVNHPKGRSYSDTDRAALAAVAEVTSLALS